MEPPIIIIIMSICHKQKTDQNFCSINCQLFHPLNLQWQLSWLYGGYATNQPFHSY
jgi:hypothetical protein